MNIYIFIHMCVCVHVYVHIYVCTYTYIYIYIYRSREGRGAYPDSLGDRAQRRLKGLRRKPCAPCCLLLPQCLHLPLPRILVNY